MVIKLKKIIYLLLIILLLTGCNKNIDDDDVSNKQSDEVIDTPSVVEEPKYVDDNPIVVGLYQNGKLVKDLKTSIKDGVDIASFDVYFTNDENVGGVNTKSNFNKYAKDYDLSEYKIGFYISYETSNEKKEATIVTPGEYQVAPYIYTYLYDDIHQADGSWYSHVEEKDQKEDTIYSSIKLYAAERTNEITSPITLMVFTYDGADDFDDNGYYKGNSKYTITINKG